MSVPAATGETEAQTRELSGTIGLVTSVIVAGLSLYALYWVLFVVDPQIYRSSFLLVGLVLSFLLYPGWRAARKVNALDGVLILLTVGAFSWPLLDFARFLYRAAEPTSVDLVCGTLAILLVLEATRRTVGWVLPVSAGLFLLYGYFGPALDYIGLGLFAHRGYPLDRLVGSLYMTLEGMFGIPLDVAGTYIILFSIYGAVLQVSGAGEFFLNWSMAAMGRSASGSGPGRTVTLAGFLLGTVSGSGVATTVTLGSVAWPLLRTAGFSPEVGGAILSAGGIGAILSPPTLGAAAFLIAEYLQITYLQVLVMATIPTLLYYLSVLLMIEADSRRLGTRPAWAGDLSLRQLTWKYGYHFTSLASIAVFMAMGMTAFRAVFWATILAWALSFVRTETRLGPRKIFRALESGGASILPVVATTAAAGIIVGVVTLTGLGLKIAGILVTLAGGSLFLTVLYSAIAVWMLGLAVPVTASYIIAAVMIAPALTQVGIEPAAAHMFIFYYAVLSEVSPPTALSPFAAAAITGANPIRTMMVTWKYTLPAFVVPFMFTLDKNGMALLLSGSPGAIAWGAMTAALGVAALAFGAGGWFKQKATLVERALAVGGGLLLMYANTATDVAGAVLFGAALVVHRWRAGRGEVHS